MSSTSRKKARTSFGATAPPFIDYLKDILRRYPDGGQILKELIQNADDARATKVVFIHDERNYGTDKLWAEDLAKYQGPALYAYNNAAFRDDDWEGIQKAGRSVKRNDPNKVGRFGIGFNSVYHVTDVTSIFSSGHLGIMDPQEKIFGERIGGFLWSLDDAEDRKSLMNMHDQFQPFRDIVSLVSKQEWSKVVERDKYFDGTIFRFALRTEASEISDNLYDSNKVIELFDSFIADADLSLLFLKNVTTVSLMHIRADGSVSTRLAVKSSVSEDVILESKAQSLVKGTTRFKSITVDSKEHKETKWLVTTCTMKQGNVQNLDSLAEKLSFIPQVDLAFPINEKRDCSKSRLSCFLPLPNNEPNRTGLPVHVNAYFGLTDNRRHIKWQEEDQRHDEHAMWNELLMKEVLPQAYLTIIQDAIKLAKDSVVPVSFVYDLWPDIVQLQHKEKWYNISLDVLHHLFSQNIPILSLAKDERRFITPSEAVFPCNGPTGLDVLAAIKRTLVSCGENLVTLPDRASQAIKKAYPHHNSLRHVTPAFIRDVLRKTGVRNISKGDRVRLLEYTLSDGKYSELQGLQLLPLCDGSFRSFTKNQEDTALIDSNEFPRTLLPYCKHLFIPEDLSPTCIAHLKQLATRGLFKVINIDAHKVTEYTRSHMPKDWLKMGKGLVNWDVGSDQHPPLAWLQEFWKFLNIHFKELSSFTGMPLIPVSSLTPTQPVSLARLQKNTTLISEKSKVTRLPEQIAQLLNKAGGTVVRENNWLKHEDLDSYVLSPSPRSVMKVIMNLDLQQVITVLMNASQSSLEELKGCLSGLDALSSGEKALLSKLPLFQTMKGTRTSAQSKQAVLLNAGLAIPTELPMPDSVVKCATEADRRLLQLLTVHLLDTASAAILLINCIEKGACSKKDTENTMTWILDHGNVLFSQNQTLKHQCTNLKFIEVNGERKKTSSFFDPRVKSFKVIFESDFFPSPLYTNTPQRVASLLDMGLMNKEVQVSPEHLLRAATLIEKLHVISPKEAHERAQVLLEMLDAHDLLNKFSKEQLQHLKRLKWIPCTKAGETKAQCNDKSLKSSFYCPDDIRHSMYRDIVGLVMPLEGNLSHRLCSTLGLKRIPPAEKVEENLLAFISKAQEMTDPNTNENFKRTLGSIYGHMQNHISEFAALMSKDTKWLWNHNEFVSPQDLVLKHPHNLDLSSYIGEVPGEFLPYKKLLLAFGLKTSLRDEEIVAILHSIKQTIEGREQPVATPSEVRASIEILNWLWKEKKMVQDDIPVPVIIHGGRCTLKPRSMTVFCDVSRKGLQGLKYNQEEIYVVHEEILRATAEWLNIQFLSTYILDPELVGIEQCGQSEPITTRIKNILKEYDEESDIFKEIIQNAEDAGAEACKFLVDFRMHKDPPEDLIDPDMSLCQGPCIWAFNDKQFSADDWANIVRVGAASKENKVEKIGKFGLGFNTVYHLTDIPSILSGRSLLILDPNVTHLTKHIKHKTNPGIKLDLLQQQVLSCFPGQFRPYEHIFGCSFTSKSPPAPYPGTLIKLPFRTQEEALKSEISTKVYHNQDVATFQEQFSNNSQSHLLFLKNINTVSLQNISNYASTPPRDGEIQSVFTVSKTTVSTVKIPEESCVSKQRQAEQSLTKLDRKCKDIINCCDVSIVEITREQSGETQVQSWLLYNCFGTNESLQMAINKNKKFTFSLPIGGIAVPLQKNPETGKFEASQTKVVGQAFCFLPLSIHTGLPVNINGTFAVTSNRKGLWESGVKHEWNKALLQDPVVTAYVTALSVLKNMSENDQLENYSYYTFWPDREKVSETFKPLVDAFYATIAQHSIAPQLFSNGKQWCSMKNAIFLDESIEEDKNISTLAMQVCEKYMKNANLIIPLPMWLRNSFKQAGLGDVLQDRTWNWETFYREAVFKNLANMDPEWRDTLILHAIDLNLKTIDSLLINYPCIPTTSGRLQYVNKLVNPSGKVACLFEQEEGRLLGGTISDFCSPNRIQRLMELGMATDELPLEDIAVKAETITTTWITDKQKAYGRLKCLLDLMKCHMFDDSPSWEKLRMTEFLPAFSPGDAKMERDVTLKRPTDVFSDECALLVSMTQPVLDHSNLKIHHSDPILQVLGVHNSPPSEIVIQQLKEAYKQSQCLDKSVLHKVAYECYKFLDHCLCDSENAASISQSAKSFPFVLVGDTFVSLDRVAEKVQFEAKPYLHVIPPAFINFRRLWENVGVEKNFTLSQCLTVLHELRTKHREKPLPKNDLEICLTILNRGIYEANEQTPGDCPVPNERGVLQPASQLFFNDSQWMPVSSEVMLCHNKIPRVMALHFGIKTTRHHTLQNHVVDNISPFAFQFQQQEQLTVRIKNIISAYPAKKDILKELIQNADDAEATEIHFVWDKRHHSNEKTFGDKWKPLQGPALCVFNDKVFSDADLAGIQQLGEGGKHNSPGKTGKYGLGFNSVYHLTDCPSIVTGDKLLCIFDPNQNYIESSSEISPAGIGYNLADIFKEMYLDVYNSFLPDTFPLKNGTMFRLPLRVDTLAASSKISQHAVTDHDMEELCSALSEDPEGLILFLKNICKINVHEINESGTLQTIFTVEKTLPKSSQERKDTFANLLEQALQSEKPAGPQKAVYRTIISTSNKREREWIIAEQFGSFKNSEEQKMNSTATLPHAAVAARVGLKLPASEPFSSKEFNGAAFCSLPLPGKTGLPVHVNGNFEVDSARRNLWKEDGLSLKSNWNEFLKQNVIAPLYADLLHYISRNIPVKKVSPLELELCLYCPYLYFFPTVSKHVGQDWHEMIHEVYRSLEERHLKVIPVLESSTRMIADWHVKEYSFNWCNITKTESTDAPHLTHSGPHQLTSILEDVGMKLVPFSDKMQQIWKSFKSAGIEVKDVNPSTVQTFLRNKPLNDPSKTNKQLPLPIADTLIRNQKRCSLLLDFCLKGLIPEHNTKAKAVKPDSTLLDGLPLLLTRDKVLRVFNSKTPKLISRYDSLFIGYEDQFADHQTNRDHIKVLQTLNLVNKLTVPCAAKYLRPLIQLFLQKCEVVPENGHRAPSEEMSEWLKSLWKFLTSELQPAVSGNNEDNLTLRVIREHYSDCCILPVVCPRLNNKHFLLTMKDMSSVIHFASEKNLSSILFKLGIMKINTAFFNDVHKQLHSHLYSELMDVNDKDSVLDQLYKMESSEFSKLSGDEVNELQDFLNSGVSKSKDNQGYQRKFKSLPLFETIHGERVKIDGVTEVFILDISADTMSRFPDLFTLQSHNIFLKGNPKNLSLSQTLNIKTLSDLEYFVKFILPIVHKLTARQMSHCLKWCVSLKHHQNYFQFKDQIITSLKTVKLIRSSLGNLEMASYYFDDRIELYKTMLAEDRFVPETFWTELCEGNTETREQIKQLLIELGMRHIVSTDDIIKFARQIESETKGNGCLDKLKQKSSLLFREALTFVDDQHNDKNGGGRLLESLADIKFIFPVTIKKELRDYHQPFVAGRTAVTIRGSLIESDQKYEELIWSSMPIIKVPHYKTPKILKLLKNAGALEQPPSQCVTTNMSNICRSPCRDEKLIETRANVFRSSYAYLEVNEFESQQLAGLPVVLVEKDKDLVRTEVASFSLNKDLEFRPYLYKLPPKLIAYEDFFKKIGLTQEPTATQYCNVLAAVHNDSHEKPELNPNQEKTVKRAVQQLFKLIKNEGNQALDAVKTLYLPAVNGKLIESCQLYYNNTTYEARRLEKALRKKVLLLESLRECHLGPDIFEHHRLLQLLPQKFQPKMLTDFTEERLVESHMELCESSCEFSGWFDRHLSSHPFRHGVICLIRGQSHGKVTQEDATDLWEKTFGSIRITCCESLKTELWLDNQPLNTTATETDVFVKQGKDACVFYLRHNDDTNVKVISEVCGTLAKEINVLLGNRFSSLYLMALAHLLMCDNLEDVRRTLAKNAIHDSVETESFLRKPPAPGTEIPEEWHDSLDMDILNNFEEGEYVGYYTSNKYIYAIIVKELPGLSGPYSWKYQIDIGKDAPIEVGCVDLYQFKCEKKPAPEKWTQSSCMMLVPVDGAQPHSSQQSSTSSPSSSSSSSSSSRSTPATLDEAKREIDKCLADIWTLPKEDRNKAIKRLYLRWHPDKNPDCQQLATEAFKYLQNKIDELTTGKSKAKASGSSHGRTSDPWDDFKDFFHQWNEEARHHRHGRERFYRNNRSYNFWTHNDNVPRPNREEAQRWFKQARCDLNAAQKDTGGGSTEWCLFKVHQAVEKALIAACYKHHGERPSSTSISDIAMQVYVYSAHLRTLPDIVKDLKLLGVDPKKTQYPNCHPNPRIPNEAFKSENEKQALDKASELLTKVQAYVN